MTREAPNGTTRLVRRAATAIEWLVARDAHRAARLVSMLTKRACGVEVLPGATIGPGLVVWHGEGTIIGPNVVIGEDCTIHHQISLGYRHNACPRIGDRVTIYPGAKLFGPITVGDDAVVGANAVVLKDVAPGSLVVAPPAQEVQRRSRDQARAQEDGLP